MTNVSCYTCRFADKGCIDLKEKLECKAYEPMFAKCNTCGSWYDTDKGCENCVINWEEVLADCPF